MTDNEIIKALKRCSDEESITCDGCPYDMECQKNSVSLVCKDALDFINRQKTEIERLNAEIEEANKANREAELQTLRENKENAKVQLRAIEHAKSEALKEFAERLKTEIISDTAYGCDCNQHSGYYDYTIKIGDIPEYIDDLVKEMTEE